MSKASDLEERLINFSVSVFTQTKNIANTRDYRSLVDQVRRSATSPALNYGEAQSAESTNDFIHKLGIVVKEFRELTMPCGFYPNWVAFLPKIGYCLNAMI